jgi:DNA end-binding protein Ku
LHDARETAREDARRRRTEQALVTARAAERGGGRAMWKASLEFGGVALPVKLYAAAEDRDVHFRLLHAKDKAPVQQQMVDPRTEEPVEPDAIRRGVELEPGVFVVLTDEELDALAPEPSRAIEVLRFVPAGAIDAAWYSRPYFLGPDGSASDYAALVAALRDSGLHGVARWAMRGRRSFGALAAHHDVLTLVALRRAEEVVEAKDLARPQAKPVSAAERKLAEQLVAALDAPFDPAALRDEYRERLLEFVEAKAKGRRVRTPREALPKPVTDLSRALEQSLASAKRRAA